MNEDDQLHELSFTVSGRIARPPAEVYEAIADPHQLSQYFTTGGAQGRLESATVATWAFGDFPGAFPVTVVEATPPERIVIRWGGEATTGEASETTVTFELEPIDGGARTLVTISESSWLPTAGGARSAFGNCEGWTSMLSALKAWLEHGINLRQGFYA